MAGLSVLGIGSFDGEQSTAEVERVPTQLEDLTAPEAGVQGEQDGRCQVIAEVREQREQFLVPVLPSSVA